MKQIFLLDTTLRDGQQCPGAGMSFENNVKYAHMIAIAMNGGGHTIEAGFAAASKTDHQIVSTIADEIGSQSGGPVIASLAQLRQKQIEDTIRALEHATKYNKGRLHVYVPVDPKLLKASMQIEHGDYKAKEQIQKKLYDYVKMAHEEGLQVQFSPEGYSMLKRGEQDNFDFTRDLIQTAIEGGATIINCPDTIGAAHRRQGNDYFINTMKRHQTYHTDKNLTWSIHCHNDFGLALTNTLAGLDHNVAQQLECTTNGVGERAGNAALEEIVINVKYYYGDHTLTFDTTKLQLISDFISKHMLTRQANKSITGDNAYRHGSGGHTNAIINDPLAYSPIDPNETGGALTFAFGPLSGGNHAQEIIITYGEMCHDNEKVPIAQFIKDYYPERRKGVTDEEVMIAYHAYRQQHQKQ